MAISRSGSDSRWVTAPRCATSMSLATICGCLGPGQNAKMKSNAETFLDQLRTWQAEAGLELWFADECGVEGDPRPRRRWSARGGRPKVPYLGDHIRANVIGAVCPASGECCTMIFDGVDTDVFQYYLDFLAEDIPALDSKRRLLIVDNASLAQSPKIELAPLRGSLPARLQPRSQSQSNGSGCASKSTSLATSLRRAPSNLPSVFVTL